MTEGEMPPLRQAIIEGRQQSWREAELSVEGQEGAGLPLVLLHGIGSNSRVWLAQFSAFGGTRRVVAWNAPGYAGSAALPAAAPSPEDYAEAARSWLDHLKIGRCILVGQSLGAIKATALTLRYPSRVAALVLASPASGYAAAADEPLPLTIVNRIALMERLGPAALARERADRLLSTGASQAARQLVATAMGELVPEGYAQAARMLGRADLAAMVGLLEVPVMIAWGAEDEVTPPASCMRIAAAAGPRATRIELPAAGHACMADAPIAFNEAVATAIAGASGTDTEKCP